MSTLPRALIVAALLFWATPSFASTITLTYTGGLNYMDVLMDVPIEQALEAAFDAHGARTGPSPVTFIMTIESSAPARDVGGGWFDYPSGLVNAVLRIGDLRYETGPGYLDSYWLPWTTPVTGSTVRQDGYDLTVRSLTTWQSATKHPFQVGGITAWNDLTLLFDNGSGTAGWNTFTELQLQSVTVPEPHSLVTLSGALIAFVAIQLRSRKRLF